MGKKKATTSKKSSVGVGGNSQLKDVHHSDVFAKVPRILTTPKSAKRRLDTLLPGYIWVVPDFLTTQECQEWVNFMDNTVSPELLQQRGTRLMAARQCYRYQLSRANGVATELYDRLAVTCPGALKLLQVASSSSPSFTSVAKCTGCNPNIRLYKYTKNMSFGKHVDGSNYLKDTNEETRMTVLIYLTNCQGGATRFEKPDGKGEIAYEPRAGSMLIHLHGDDCLLHSADAVESGEKYVFRTDLVYPVQG